MQPEPGSASRVDLGALLARGRFAEAEQALRAALVKRPGDAEMLNNLANVLETLGRPAEAEAAYAAAIAARPDFAAAHYNLGLLLQSERRLDEAEAAYRRALALRADLAQAHNNLGAVLRDQRRLDEAMAAFDTAIRLRPDYADAQFNQAMCRLMTGDDRRGWAQYEWRWRVLQARAARRDFAAPAWLGGELVRGERLLIHAEQGLGDSLQFCRFVPLAAQRGPVVILEVQPGLERLLARLDGVGRTITRGQPPPAFDRHTPLMSLPLALDAGSDAVQPPYLSADPLLAAQWARRITGDEGLRVGLCWAGAARPDQPIAKAVDRRRSLPLNAFAPLIDLKGVRIFSLQKGSAAAELGEAERQGWLGGRMIDYTAALGDFDDTAALVANLDLVVTCDTAVAHLAGALGKPVWILSRFDGCWRWLAGRDDSPWYPSARLYRQDRPGDWAPVVERVVTDLRARRL